MVVLRVQLQPSLTHHFRPFSSPAPGDVRKDSTPVFRFASLSLTGRTCIQCVEPAPQICDQGFVPGQGSPSWQEADPSLEAEVVLFIVSPLEVLIQSVEQGRTYSPEMYDLLQGIIEALLGRSNR